MNEIEKSPNITSDGIQLEDICIEKSIKDINHENCIKRADELHQMIRDNKLVLPVDESYFMGKKVWVLEYGDIPTHTSIRKKYLRVRYPEDTYSSDLPWVEWAYEVKGNRQNYFADQLYNSRREAELAAAKDKIKGFITSFGYLVERNHFTKEDFPELENFASKIKLLK